MALHSVATFYGLLGPTLLLPSNSVVHSFLRQWRPVVLWAAVETQLKQYRTLLQSLIVLRENLFERGDEAAYLLT